MFNFDYHNPNDFWIHKYEKHNEDHDEDDDYVGALKGGCFVSILYVIAFAVLAVACALFSSCTTTQYVPVIEHKTDTVLWHSIIHDSIYLHDSVSVKEKGDMVRIEKWHTKYVSKEVHDTTYISKTDSVPVPYEVIKEVPRQRSTLEWVLSIVGFLSTLGIIVWVANKVKRFLPGM